eukprot:CAMPEP_0203747622 /NCGR_PEP_ID=MMETSP0098-20131031/2716_1 /ASSEMBLY_ACC=CAM_ASM_000208 /TAXON_ID=96639 /ORGANISM=" , Strain NY0313808BC1" /LENGTH=759 /DNA_ID=CAMNT_0050636089 /DNA_START=711 /DNA_END=2990 /DNA_ORIENTATION=-
MHWVQDVCTGGFGMEMEAYVESCSYVQIRWKALRFDIRQRWICGLCTFDNSMEDPWRCHMCNGRRQDEFGVGDAVEYQVKFYRQGKKFETYRHSNTTQQYWIKLNGLEPNTEYFCKLRYRIVSTCKDMSGIKDPFAWVKLETMVFRTLSKDHAHRIETLRRVDKFLKNSMDPFPELGPKPDTIVEKVARVSGNILTATGFAGLSGAWRSLAKGVHSVHKNGLANVIFRDDVHKMVIAVAAYVYRVAKDFGLSSKEITLGAYYMIWEHKRSLLLGPQHLQENAYLSSDDEGVLQEQVDNRMLIEMGKYLGFSQICYRDHPSEIQWVLNGDDFELVGCKTSAEKNRPAFALMASRTKKEVILAIRGTREADDLLTNADFEYEEYEFHFDAAQAKKYKIHRGMACAAKWLLAGLIQEEKFVSHPEKKPKTTPNLPNHGENPGAGLGAALEAFYDAGFKVTLCGHSLGAGVSTIMALFLVDSNPNISVRVFGVGPPPCVDLELANACKTEEFKLGHHPLDGRITVHNIVNQDDLVSRLSIHQARLLAAEIKRLKPQWVPIMEQDLESYKNRVKALWPPSQRGAQNPPQREKSNPEILYASCDDTFEPQPLVIPGLIIQTFHWHGKTKAALCDYRFKRLRAIQPSETSLSDHKLKSIHSAIRNVFAFRRLSEEQLAQLPVWQGIEEHHANGLYVKCIVCKHFVGWKLSGNSEAMEVRAINHCYSCGKIVCSSCSTKTSSLPSFGIVTPVRVCDICYYDLASEFK